MRELSFVLLLFLFHSSALAPTRAEAYENKSADNYLLHTTPQLLGVTATATTGLALANRILIRKPLKDEIRVKRSHLESWRMMNDSEVYSRTRGRFGRTTMVSSSRFFLESAEKKLMLVNIVDTVLWVLTATEVGISLKHAKSPNQSLSSSSISKLKNLPGFTAQGPGIIKRSAGQNSLPSGSTT